MEFDLSIDIIDMGHKLVPKEQTVTVLVECPEDPIKFDLSIEKGDKPVPEGSNAIQPVTSEIALPQFLFT